MSDSQIRGQCNVKWSVKPCWNGKWDRFSFVNFFENSQNFCIIINDFRKEIPCLQFRESIDGIVLSYLKAKFHKGTFRVNLLGIHCLYTVLNNREIIDLLHAQIQKQSISSENQRTFSESNVDGNSFSYIYFFFIFL